MPCMLSGKHAWHTLTVTVVGIINCCRLTFRGQNSGFYSFIFFKLLFIQYKKIEFPFKNIKNYDFGIVFELGPSAGS